MAFQCYKKMAAITAGAMLFGSSFSAIAAEVVRMGHIYETSEAFHKQAEWAGEQIEKRTDGRYELQVFPSSQLGSESSLLEGLTQASVDIMYTGIQRAGRDYGPIGIVGAPYMMNDYAHWERVRDSGVFQELADGYKEKTGNHILALNYYGERHVSSNKEIDKPADMDGLKIRVPTTKLHRMFPEAVGAAPTPIDFSEVYLALQQGVVEAQENPLPTIQAKKFYEVQDYINLTGHITDSLLTIMSGNFWKSLSEEDKAVFAEVFEEAAQRSSSEVRQREAELIGWFNNETETTINKVDRAPFREATAPSLVSDDVPWSKELYESIRNL